MSNRTNIPHTQRTKRPHKQKPSSHAKRDYRPPLLGKEYSVPFWLNASPLHKFFVFIAGGKTPIAMEIAGETEEIAKKRLYLQLGRETPCRIVPYHKENWPAVQTIGHGGRLYGAEVGEMQ